MFVVDGCFCVIELFILDYVVYFVLLLEEGFLSGFEVIEFVD